MLKSLMKSESLALAQVAAHASQAIEQAKRARECLPSHWPPTQLDSIILQLEKVAAQATNARQSVTVTGALVRRMVAG